MGIVVDLIIVLIIGLCIFAGYKKGLTRCLLKIATSVIAIIVAVSLYRPFANFVIENTTIDNNIQLSLEKVINNGDSQENTSQTVAVREDTGIPKPIVEYLNKNIKDTVEEQKQTAVTSVSKSATLIIVNIACVIILYILAKIILSIITVLTDIITKLPLIKQFNEIGGIAYGLIQGLFIVLIAMTIISVITPLTGGYELANMITGSHIGSFLYNNNIILNIIF